MHYSEYCRGCECSQGSEGRTGLGYLVVSAWAYRGLLVGGCAPGDTVVDAAREGGNGRPEGGGQELSGTSIRAVLLGVFISMRCMGTRGC